jgi:hypothetical protein
LRGEIQLLEEFRGDDEGGRLSALEASFSELLPLIMADKEQCLESE